MAMALRNWLMFLTAWLKKMVSSANRSSSYVVPSMRWWCGRYGRDALTSAMRTVMNIMKRYGDKGQPCLIPDDCCLVVERRPSISTNNSGCVYKFLMTLIIVCGILRLTAAVITLNVCIWSG